MQDARRDLVQDEVRSPMTTVWPALRRPGSAPPGRRARRGRRRACPCPRLPTARPRPPRRRSSRRTWSAPRMANEKEPLAGLLNPRANLRAEPPARQSWRGRRPIPRRDVERQAVRPCPAGCGSAGRPPGEPADRHGGHAGASERQAIGRIRREAPERGARPDAASRGDSSLASAAPRASWLTTRARPPGRWCRGSPPPPCAAPRRAGRRTHGRPRARTPRRP